jgi:hypothetical protein
MAGDVGSGEQATCSLVRPEPYPRIVSGSHLAIRGHVFCSFLALAPTREMKDRCDGADLKPESDRLIRDLGRLLSGDIVRVGRMIALHRPVADDAGPVFRAVGVALRRRSARSLIRQV